MKARRSVTPHRRRLAVRYAVALVSTRARYVGGYMSRETYKSHIGSLWGTVVRLGLEKLVLARAPEFGRER